MDARGGGGSGNASSGGAGASGCCYYALLGIRKNASATDIRTAYRRLALKWHPDRWASNPSAAGEAKRRFQRIQEAYSGKAHLLPRPCSDTRDLIEFSLVLLACSLVGQGEEGHVRRRGLRPPRRRRSGFLRLHAGDAGDDGYREKREAGHAGGPAEDAGRHSQRRRRQPRRRRARAVGRDPADARLAVPAAAAVTGAPVYEMYTRASTTLLVRETGA